MAYRRRYVELSVTDDGTATPGAAPAGSGLASMRDRAEALGGTLQAGPRAEGGFAVRALLPYRGASA